MRSIEALIARRAAANVSSTTRWEMTSRALVGSSATIRLRPEQERQRDADPLPHAAAQFVRVTRQDIRLQADAAQGFREARAHRGAGHPFIMGDQGIGELILQAHDGVERAH